MPTAAQCVCKYDPEHGSFGDAARLGAHYREAHADVHTPTDNPPAFQVVCTLCERQLSSTSIGPHLKNVHGKRAPFTHWWERAEDYKPKPKSKPAVAAPAARQVEVEVSEVGLPLRIGTVLDDDDVERPVDVDDIVLPIIEGLAAPFGVIPVSALGALFVWREATAVMLREVSEKHDDPRHKSRGRRT